MPFCKDCGAFYTKSLGVCPTCNAEKKLEEYEALEREAQYAPKMGRESRKRLIQVAIFVPALIGLLYGMIYIMVKSAT